MTKVGLLGMLLVGACGAAQPTTTPKTPDNKAAGSAAVTAAGGEPARASCAGVAKLIIAEHGVKDIPAAKQDRAKRGGEAELEANCVDNEWPQAALDCMATRPSAISCTGQLSEEQQQFYEQAVAEWQQKWMRPDAGVGGAGYGGQGYGGAGGVAGGQDAPPPPQEEWVPCELSAQETFAPEIKANAHDHDFAVSVRKRDLQNACEMRWTNADKKCFNAAKDGPAVAACRSKLDDPAKNGLDNLFADEDARLRQVAALEKQPKAIDCKAVSAAHYADDAWRNKLMGLSPAERARVMKESREKLTKACGDDKWQVVQRACVVLIPSGEMHETDMQQCFPDDKEGLMYKWGFPAGGVTFKTGIFECDQLADVVEKLASCDALPKETRQMLKDSIGPQLASWIDGGMGRGKDETAKMCKQMVTSYMDAGKQQGCKM